MRITRLIVVLAAMLGSVVDAHAYETVVCFADSMATEPGPTTNYCAQLQALRPELVVKNRSAGGRTTLLALTQVSAVVDEACGATSCLVLIHHGLNDLNLPDPDAWTTAKRLRAIWSKAQGSSRAAWILTPLPFLDSTLNNNPFARDVGNAAFALARRRIPVFDTRDLFAFDGWWAGTTDGTHPNETGAFLIAGALAEAIP